MVKDVAYWLNRFAGEEQGKGAVCTIMASVEESTVGVRDTQLLAQVRRGYGEEGGEEGTAAQGSGSGHWLWALALYSYSLDHLRSRMAPQALTPRTIEVTPLLAQGTGSGHWLRVLVLTDCSYSLGPFNT